MKRAGVWLLAGLGLSCQTALGPKPEARGASGFAPPPQHAFLGDLAPVDRAWALEAFAGLDLAERAAQLVMVRANGMPTHPDSPSRDELLREITDLRVGGIVLFRSELESVPPLLEELQSRAALPLLVSIDAERSLAFRVPYGTVALPTAMAIGAIGDPAEAEAAARFAGELTARESRALGVHWALGPVADVNSDPRNPVINLRSFGEDPRRVARLVRAFVEGAKTAPAGMVLTSVKHFPGHGDSAVDSHDALPTLDQSRERLLAVDLPPFRAAIEAGVDSVMLGHLAVPALDASGRPATLSRPMAHDLLREELGFAGLVVTDAMEMRGVGGFWAGEAAVEAVRAGADVLLLPADPRVAIQSLVRAVEEGLLSRERLDEAALRVLATKARLGLHREVRRPWADRRREIGRPADESRAREIAERSITVVRNEASVLPLRVEEPLRVLHVIAASDSANPLITGVPESELAARGIRVRTRRLGASVPESVADAILREAADSTHVLVSAFVRNASALGDADVEESQLRLLERLAEGSTPVVVVSFGSPYLLSQLPSVDAYVCAYGGLAVSQRAAVRALLGEIEVNGRLPVRVSDAAPVGWGIAVPRRDLKLGRVDPVAAGFDPAGLAELDRVLEDFRSRGAFPGAVVAVGRRGRLAHLRAIGNLSYEPDSPPVTTDTVFDIASLTKVVATTTMAMMLLDAQRLDLDRPVQAYLPRFVGPGKEKVTVRHLLTHSSGIDWWAPLYESVDSRAVAIERILAMDLVYEPGTQSKYSDLGILLLGEILERVAGVPFEEFVAKRVFEPLAMGSTRFRPPVDWLPRIAPTEVDGWRGRLVHGEVHDENAFAIGGVAPHAGLFSSAPDLSRFAQMLLWDGMYDHRRLVSRATLAEFTRRSTVPGSTRALGWDTKSPTGSSAGALFSPFAWGHTGFTGTSLWIDPERDLFVVLLTNRVHPTRENTLIRQVRPAVADAVLRAVRDPEPLAIVETGLDRIARGKVTSLDGKRLGWIAHAASVTADGRHALDVARERGLNVVRVFSPEHGLQGTAGAGVAVPDAVSGPAGVPVVSLYGDRTRPRAADLEGLDALVFDLQDAGVRFYTYAHTLFETMEAAAEAGVEFVVLDRPNPLGGDRVAGPWSAPRSVVRQSPVNRTPGPLVHGLTMGELARWWNSQLATPVRLTVVELSGWRRFMTWRETGRVWTPPSPNLRTFEAAVAYPGVALLEATNVSEGRGSDSPFLLLGAPWIEADEPVIAQLRQLSVAGLRLEPATFTPQASESAPYPKHRDTECTGLRVEVTAHDTADAWRLGLELLSHFSRHPGFSWNSAQALAAIDLDGLTWLLGTPDPLARLRAGASAQEIVDEEAAGLARWLEARRSVLLYD